MNTFDERHGGPFDRGRADYYYNRGVNPHYYVGATKASALVKESAMLPTETEAYMAGYAEGEADGDQKDWR